MSNPTESEWLAAVHRLRERLEQAEIRHRMVMDELKKIAAMAEAHHIQIAPHCYCGPIVAAANIQVSATLPNFLILEAIKTFDGFHAELLERKIEWQDGHVIPSSAPGLGVELNEAFVEAHPYVGTDLHLNMMQSPL